MNRFTDAIDAAISSGNFYAALALSLAIPDVCGWLATPNEGTRLRYAAWFEKYVQPRYTRRATANHKEEVFLGGGDAYALRCSFLHQGSDDVSGQPASVALESFRFVVSPPGWNVHNNLSGDRLQLQVDIFCKDICDGVAEWLRDVSGDAGIQQRMATLLVIERIGAGTFSI
jgi:hypothetical protein